MKKYEKVSNSIGLWSFIFVIAIGFDYLNRYIWQDSNIKLLFTGGKVISYFLFLSGYFLMKRYKQTKNSSKAPSGLAWDYFLSKLKKLYPILFSGVLISFIVRNIINHTSITNIFTIFMNSIWEFLGLSQIGIGGLVNIESLSFTPAIGVSYLWNYPLWIISAILISSFILYYIINKNEDIFKGLIAPLIIIITYANIGLTTNKLDIDVLNTLGIPNGLARVFACMTLGILMYYIVEFLQKKKFNELMMMFFSFLHIGCAIFFLYTIYAGISWSELINGVFLYIFCIVLLVNKDYISVLYNRSMICKFLGRLAIYYYGIFIVVIYLLTYIFPYISYETSLLFNCLFSTGIAFILLCLIEMFIMPKIKK